MKTFFLTLAAAALAVCAWAKDPLRITASDSSSGTTSFMTWNVSGGGTEAPNADNDYVCADGFAIRAPNSGSSQAFEGNSLRIGEGNTSGALIVTRTADTTVNFKNQGLFLENGSLRSWLAEKKYTFTGTISICSPFETPFEIWITDANNHLGMTYVFNSTLKAAGGTGVSLVNRFENPSGKVVLKPVSAEEFLGTIIVGNDERTWPVLCECQGENVSMPGGFLVKSGCSIEPQNASTRWTVGSLDLKDNATLGAWRASDADSTAAPITVTRKVSLGKNIMLNGKDGATFYAGNSYSIPLIATAAGATGILDASAFTDSFGRDPTAHECLPRFGFETVPNDLGGETVRYHQFAVRQIKSRANAVYSGETAFPASSLTDADSIQGGALPGPGYDYVITKTGFAGKDGNEYTGTHLYTPNNVDAYEFGGESLTIGKECTFRSAITTLTIGTLRLMGSSTFYPRLGNGTASVLKGEELFVGPENESANGALVCVYANLKWTCEPALTGSGLITFQANEGSGKPQGKAVLTGLSTNFLGKIRVTASALSAKINTLTNECVEISDARNLGGPLDSPTADALRLENWGTLEVKGDADVDFSTKNRGLTVGNFGQIRVSDGRTLKIGNPITYEGELHQVGDGKLVLAAAAAAGSSARLAVDAGNLVVANGEALKDVTLACAKGATVSVDIEKLGAKGAEIGAVDGNALTLALVYPEGTTELSLQGLALCTVPKGVAVSVKRPHGYRVVLSSSENDDGTVTWFADVDHTGALIILR